MYVAADTTSALQHSSNTVFSKHVQPGNLPAYSIRECNPACNLLEAANGVVTRGQTPIPLATKWQKPVFSSNSMVAGSKLKTKCQAKALPPVHAVNGDSADPVTCQQDPAPAASNALSHAVKKNVNLQNDNAQSPATSVSKTGNALFLETSAAASAAVPPHLPAANVQIPPALTSSVQQESAQLQPSGASPRPNAIHATEALGQIKLPAVPSAAATLANHTAAKVAHPTGKPVRVRNIPAKAALPKAKLAATTCTAQQPAAGGPWKKKASGPTKRKLIAPSLGIASLFEMNAEQPRPEQSTNTSSSLSNTTAGVSAEDQRPLTAGNTCTPSPFCCCSACRCHVTALHATKGVGKTLQCIWRRCKP